MRHKVLHILNSVTGGIGRVLALTSPRVRKLGIEPLVINLSGRYLEAAREGLRDIPCYDFSFVGIGERLVLPFCGPEMKARREIRCLVQQLNPQVIHTHYFHTDILAAPIAESAGIPQVVHIHGINKALRSRRAVRWPWTADRAYMNLLRKPQTFVLLVSPYLRETLAQCGVTDWRGDVLVNGVDCDCFTPAGKTEEKTGKGLFHACGNPPSRPWIVFVGRLDANKDVSTAIRALGLLKKNSVLASLLVVGGGPEREPLDHLARSQDVAEQVVFLGERSDIPDILRSSDIFCLPSLLEGMSVSTLEAMAAGLPVVASDIPAMRAIITAGESGLLATPGHAEAFAEALGRLIINGRERESMGQSARQRAVDRYSVDVQAEKMAEFYRRILKKS